MPNIHDHQYLGNTSCTDHSHIVSGVSGPAIYYAGYHIHLIEGRTTFMDNHYHDYRVCSGANIDLPGGFHVHPISFQTFLADDHTHVFCGYDQAAMYERVY